MAFIGNLNSQGLIETIHPIDANNACDRTENILMGILPLRHGISQEPGRCIPSRKTPPTYSIHKGSGNARVWLSRASRSSQAGILIGREADLMLADWRSRLLLPAIVAALFAVILGVAVDRTHGPLLGFLTIIAVLWMSASSSLLAIAGERAVFDHERQLFLSVRSYLFAKFLVFTAVAWLQTLLFVTSLGIVRWLGAGENLYRMPWAIAILLGDYHSLRRSTLRKSNSRSG